MKKIFLLLILSFLLIVGCSKSNLESISFENLKEKINNKETFVLYFTGEDNTLESKLDEIKKEYSITIYKVISSKISEKEKLDFQKIITFEEPSIVFIIDGKDPSKLAHVSDVNTSKKNIIERLKDMKFIKE